MKIAQRSAAVAVGATLLATVLATLAAPAPAMAGTTKPDVTLGAASSSVFASFGYDMKQPAGMHEVNRSESFARRVFGPGRITVLRIPLFADDGHVDELGHVRPERYQHLVRAVSAALAVNPKLTVVASRQTRIRCERQQITPDCEDFADSLKTADGTVVLWRYARLVTEYLTMLRSEGIKVGVLGIDNEPHNNESNLTPTRWTKTVAEIDRRLPFPMPRLVGNDAHNPDPVWVSKTRRVDIAGIHTHADRWAKRQRDPALELTGIARRRGIPVWNTEFHGNGSAPTRVGRFASSLGSVFDQVRMGVRSITWWGFNPGNSLRDGVMRSIDDGRWLATSAWPGVRAQAFTTPRGRFLWVVNNTDRAYWGRSLPVWRTTRFERWTNTGYATGSTRIGRGGRAVANFPARSITLVRL